VTMAATPLNVTMFSDAFGLKLVQAMTTTESFAAVSGANDRCEDLLAASQWVVDLSCTTE